jgi:hypothetical protein
VHPALTVDEPVTDRIGLRNVTGWMSRKFGAVLAEVESIDCGSLDVLLYCADDLVITTPGETEVGQAR